MPPPPRPLSQLSRLSETSGFEVSVMKIVGATIFNVIQKGSYRMKETQSCAIIIENLTLYAFTIFNALLINGKDNRKHQKQFFSYTSCVCTKIISTQDGVLNPKQVRDRRTRVADRGHSSTLYHSVDGVWVARSVLPIPIFGLFGLVHTSFWSGPYLNFGLAHIQNLVCSV